MQTAVLGMIMVPAVLSDLRNERIPNSLILWGWLAGLLYQFLTGGMMNVVSGILGALFPIVILFLLFLFKMLGAGDIKLLSVAGCFYGVGPVIPVMVLSFCLGALISVFLMVYRGIFRVRLFYFWNYIHRMGKERMPYYLAKRDGDGAVMHFSAAIFGGVMLWGVLTVLI